MKKWFQYAEVFWKNKVYMAVLILTALCGYGFKILHPVIGIDDTPHAYYFQEGLAAIVGRWVLFLLNKVISIADFAPFLTDFVAVLLLMAGVTVWCMLFYSVFADGKKEIPFMGYVFFAAIFLSCPLICEVFTYYLHNGIAIGYLCSGSSLCCLRESTLQKGKAKLPWLLGSVIGLLVALGCYESFMVVWLLGMLLLFLTEHFAGVRRKTFGALCMAAMVAVAGFLCRSIMIALITRLFGLEYLKTEAVQRSITEMAGWLLGPGALSEFAMVLKRIFVMYGVFAYAYYPIRIFLAASIVIALYSIYRAIREKDAWCFLLMVGSFVVSFLLVVIEGKATLYRSAQFLPVICGYGALVAVYGGKRGMDALRGLRSGLVTKIGNGVILFLLSCILWNQCVDMNKWFAVDYEKYQAAREVIQQIDCRLEREFDINKPVVFTGTYEVPQGIIEEAYVPYGSDTYYKMKKITDRVDIHLLEKFYRSYGVWVAQTPALSVIDWGRYAFDNDEELVKFFAMHGYKLVPLLDEALYPVAEAYSLNLPSFPQEGSIVDMGEYIIVHL